MSMLSIRLQVLIDEERAHRLEAEAGRRGVSVAALVREGIDAVLPDGPSTQERQRAIARILKADQIDVPVDPADLKRELAAMHDRVATLDER